MSAPHELMKIRHDDLMRAAARHHLAAQARQPRASRRRQLTTASARLLAGLRAQRVRPTSSRPQTNA